MVKVDVRPMLTVAQGNDVSAACNFKFNHNDNEINVRISDTMVKDGVSTDGLSLGVKNDRFDIIYDVANHAPRLRLNSHVSVKDRRVDLIYRNALKDNASSLEAKVGVDDNNTAGLVYDLSNFDKPNHKACTLKWTYRSGDMELTPAYNLGTESLSVDASYNIDDENRLKVGYCMNTNMGSLEWVNSAGTGGGGDLRITARANLADSNTAKQMPTMLIEKTWSMDS